MPSSLQKLPPPTMSFVNFICRVSETRMLFLTGLIASVILFCVFKLFYPYPDFFGDSYSYIYAASERLDINIWPIGYSKFLSCFHAITWSDTALVAFQYFTMQLTIMYLYFTLLYFYHIKGWYRNALFIFLLINPLTFYLCNTINSDALFGTFSLLWITELLWSIHRPRLLRIITHSVLLFLCFTIRNNAYYYPFVGAIAFLISVQPRWLRIGGVVLPFLFLAPFIFFTRKASYKLTGTRQYSLFTGWQLANNALYIYDQIEVDSTDLPTTQTKILNTYALQFFRRVNSDSYRDALENYVGNFFIRQPESPLKQYSGSHYIFKDERSNIVNWARASIVFEQFGKTLILQHPIAYVEYFVLPNIKHYFIPPLSHIGLYNYGTNEIYPIAAKWFHYPNNKIRVASYTFQGHLLEFYIGLFLLVNVYYAWNILRFTFRRGFSGLRTPESAVQLLLLSFLGANFVFSVASTVNILRYQYVPMVILASIGVVLGYALDLPNIGMKGRSRSYGERYGLVEPNTF